MTREDVIRWAEQASLIGKYDDLVGPEWRQDTIRELARFAALVVAHEREQCARVCEALEPREQMPGDWVAGWSDGTDDCAVAIRGRGTT